MASEQTAGWVLVLASLLLLLMSNRLDLLAVLFPVAGLVAYGAARIQKASGLTRGHGKE
jgi:hypothetical protein